MLLVVHVPGLTGGTGGDVRFDLDTNLKGDIIAGYALPKSPPPNTSPAAKTKKTTPRAPAPARSGSRRPSPRSSTMVQRALLTHGLGSYSGSRGAADWFHAFERTAAPRLGGRFPVHLASPLQHAGASEWELGSEGGAVGLRYHLNRGCGADDRDCGPDHFFPLRAARVLPSPAAGGGRTLALAFSTRESSHQPLAAGLERRPADEPYEAVRFGGGGGGGESERAGGLRPVGRGAAAALGLAWASAHAYDASAGEEAEEADTLALERRRRRRRGGGGGDGSFSVDVLKTALPTAERTALPADATHFAMPQKDLVFVRKGGGLLHAAPATLPAMGLPGGAATAPVAAAKAPAAAPSFRPAAMAAATAATTDGFAPAGYFL